MTWLFMFVLTLRLYDLRTRRIPNWATLPLIFAGFVAHYPVSPEIWLGSILLFLAWSKGWMGAGDAKLWIVLLCALPPHFSESALSLMFLTFFGTGLMQLLWRWIRKQPTTDHLAPAAWRTIPFLLLVWHVH
jgi:Flp pilus assembly protein protease CpaA